MRGCVEIKVFDTPSFVVSGFCGMRDSKIEVEAVLEVCLIAAKHCEQNHVWCRMIPICSVALRLDNPYCIFMLILFETF